MYLSTSIGQCEGKTLHLLLLYIYNVDTIYAHIICTIMGVRLLYSSRKMVIDMLLSWPDSGY